MPVPNNSQLRSEKLRDFISRQPGLVARYGIPFCFVLLLLLAACTFFISYPDIVTARAKVSLVNPPVPLHPGKNGRLVKLFKTDNSSVHTGDVIGYTESTASHDEVLRLSATLERLQYLADSGLLELIPGEWDAVSHSFSHLGELQPFHQTFMQGYIVFRDYLNSGYYSDKKRALYRDISISRKMKQSLARQKALQQQDLILATQNFTAHDTLHKQEVISNLEHRNQQSLLIGKELTIPQINASLISNEAQENSLKKEIMEIENQVLREKNLFLQVLYTYRSRVNDWIKDYILIAPADGLLRFSGFLKEQQQLKGGELIGFITNKNNSYYVEMNLPQTGFGKIKTGQTVWLSFQAYPYQEFGKIKGVVEYIKQTPGDSGYLAKVILPDGLVTELKKEILLTQGLTAEASVVTDKRMLSGRLFGQLLR